MKKIIFLIIIMFLLTGCDATYTLKLDSGVFEESLSIDNKNKNTWESSNPSYSYLISLAENSSVATDYRDEKPESNTKEAGVSYYEINKISTDDNLGLKYKSIFTKEKYKYSTIVKTNTEFLEYRYNKDKITINNIEDLITFRNYPALERLTIILDTNHNVISSNADEQNDNFYYWYFNKNNYKNKKINIEISTNYEKKQLKALESDDDGYFGEQTLILIYTFASIFLLTIGIIIYFKIRNSNR